MSTAQLQDARERAGRRLVHWAADAAVLVVFFGALLSARALMAVAAIMLLGLLAYAIWSRDPARHWIAARCLIALVVGGAVAMAVWTSR